MSASDKELEKLLEAGKRLLDSLPSPVQKLLELLDNLLLCLSEVEEIPPSIKNALSSLMESLVAERLLKHWDVDVKVAVASCITEVMRINASVALAPYASVALVPYDDDDKMREVFRLIVSSFEHLPNKSGISYTKRRSILKTVANCQLFVLMLDLGCDALLVEMFQHFLRVLRDHHPVTVFLDMKKIMTLVLEESDNISPELFSPILHYVKKDDEVPQRSRRLAEQVLTNCSSKCITFLAEAVKSSGLSLDKYSNVVVALICEGAFSDLDKKEEKQTASELSTPEQTDAPKDELCKSRVSNGVVKSALSDSSVDTESTEKQDDMNAKDEPQQLDTDSTEKQDDMNAKDEPQQLDNAMNSDLDTTNDEKTGCPVKAVNQEEKEISTKEANPSAASATKATSEGVNTSKAKLTKNIGKKIASPSKTKPTVLPTEKNTFEIKTTKQSNRKASDLKHYDEKLVGSRIRVWWPLDKTYYKGVVTSYDSSKKKHTVCYGEDGDQEILNLKRQKWYLVDESESSEDQEANQTALDEEAFTIPQKKKAKTGEAQSDNKQSKMDIPPEMLSPRYAKKDDEVFKVSQRCAEQVLSSCTSLLKMYLTEAVKSSSVSIDKHSSVVDSICERALNAFKQDKQKATGVSTPEQTCVPKRRLNLSHPHDEDPVETETPTHKRAQVQSCSTHGEIEKTAAEGEPSFGTHKSSSEPGDLQPCSVTHQLAKVKQSIVDTITSVRQFRSELETKEQSLVDTITSVRQFRSELETKEQGIVDTLTSVRQFWSEIKKKEDNLEASLQEVDVLGEKISGINKILNS